MSFPQFLFLLLLIPIPIIFHFISKKLLHKKDFPSLLFILRSDRRLLRWFLIRRLLLLLLRVGVIISLIFAASNLLIPFPFFDPYNKIILDQSLSMEKLEASSYKADIVIPNRGGVSFIHNVLKKHPIGVLVSDAQRNGFKELLKNEKRYPGINLDKISLPKGNIGIIDHQIGSPFIGEYTDIMFTILNQYKNSKSVYISLYIGDIVIRQKEVTLNQGINEIKFSLSLDEGPHKGYLVINDKDGFQFDNIRYFSLFINPLTKVIIYSLRHPERLLAALNPSFFHVNWVKTPQEEIEGDIFIIDGFPLDMISWNIGDSVPGIVCFSNAGESPYANEIPYKLSKITNISSISPFSDLKTLLNITIRYNSKLEMGRTLLYFRNGDAFLKKKKNLLFLPVSFENSDFSLHPVFIPFLYKLVSLILQKDFNKDILMDQAVILETPFNPIIVSPDDRKYIPASLGVDKYLFIHTGKSGIYEISDGFRTWGYISANPDPTETYLDTLKSEDIVILFEKKGYNNGTTFFLVIGCLLFILSAIIEKK